MDLTNASAIVTGGAGGFGSATHPRGQGPQELGPRLRHTGGGGAGFGISVDKDESFSRLISAYAAGLRPC